MGKPAEKAGAEEGEDSGTAREGCGEEGAILEEMERAISETKRKVRAEKVACGIQRTCLQRDILSILFKLCLQCPFSKHSL